MTTFRHQFIVAAFRENDDQLTTAQLAEVGGFYWPREVRAMRRLGYDLHEDAAGNWFLEGVPDAGRAVDLIATGTAHDPAEDPARVDGSPGAGTLFDLPAPPARSPYDTHEEAA